MWEDLEHYIFSLDFSCLDLGPNKWPGFENILSIHQEMQQLSHREVNAGISGRAIGFPEQFCQPVTSYATKQKPSQR